MSGEKFAEVKPIGGRMDVPWELRCGKFPVVTTDAKKLDRNTLDHMAIQINEAVRMEFSARLSEMKEKTAAMTDEAPCICATGPWFENRHDKDCPKAIAAAIRALEVK